MPECLCPNCQTLFKASSSAFGEKYQCAVCRFEFKLDTVHLARYQLPKIIHIRLLDSEGKAFTKFSVPIMIEYGYRLPPLKSDSSGEVTVTQEMFLKAKQDEIATGIMDYKGDYSLNRFIRIKVLVRNEAIKLAEMRKNSGWPISEFEKELFSDMQSLLSAYIPDENIVPVETTIDLSPTRDVIETTINIATL